MLTKSGFVCNIYIWSWINVVSILFNLKMQMGSI